MPTVDEILAGSPLAGLRRVSRSGGDRQVTAVRLAERFAELDHAPHTSMVILSRAASAEVTDYRLDMALRWASIHKVAAVAAFAAERWRPTVTVTDIAGRADIALVSIPMDTDLTELVQAIMREIGGGAEQALGRAQEGLDAVLRAEQDGTDLDKLCATVSQALGTAVEFRPLTQGDGDSPVNGVGGYRMARHVAWGAGSANDGGRRSKRADRGWRDAIRVSRGPACTRRRRCRRPAGPAYRGIRCCPGSSTWRGGPASYRSVPERAAGRAADVRGGGQ